MNVNFLKDAEIVSSLCMSDDDSSNDDDEESSFYSKFKNKMKNLYRDSQENLYYSSADVNILLKQRFNSRINYFKRFKKKYNLPDKIDSLFLQYLEHMYYNEKSINYNYVIKKMCDYLNIPCNIKIKEKETLNTIWIEFLKTIYKYEKS